MTSFGIQKTNVARWQKQKQKQKLNEQRAKSAQRVKVGEWSMKQPLSTSQSVEDND